MPAYSASRKRGSSAPAGNRNLGTKKARGKRSADRGLTKIEKLQVTTLAKQCLEDAAESKYFNTNGGIVNYAPSVATQTGGVNSEISCWGFTTGARRASPTPSAYSWGQDPVNGNLVNMTSLNLNYVFRDTATPASRAQYSLDGQSCRPAYNEVKWLFERPQSNTIVDPSKGVPYQIRMLRLVPRATKASFQAIDPRLDCFLDQLNEPYGISSIDGSGAAIFNLKEFHLAKANSRRYKVIQDTTFNMNPTSIRTDIFAPVGATNDNPLVNQPDASGVKVLKTKHNIGTQLHYADPNDTSSTLSQYPDTGFEPEFILFMVAALGGVEQVGDLTDNIRLSARPVSTFKDL